MLTPYFSVIQPIVKITDFIDGLLISKSDRIQWQIKSIKNHPSVCQDMPSVESTDLESRKTTVVCISGKLADTTNSKLSRILLIKAIMTYTKTHCDYSQWIQRKFSRIV